MTENRDTAGVIAPPPFHFSPPTSAPRDVDQQWMDYADQGRGVSLGLAREFFRPAPFAMQRCGPESKSFNRA
jgi:hypothetical protein